MGEVIDIQANLPHLSGEAICLNCSYKWVAVAPVGVVSLECAECGLMKGVFKNVVCPDSYWQCNCGCVHFFISSTGNTLCAHCGKVQVFP